MKHLEVVPSQNAVRTMPLETRALLTATRAVLELDDFQTCARTLFDAACEVTGARSGYVALSSEAGTENELLFLEAGGLECTVDESLPMPIRGLRERAYADRAVVYDNDFMRSEWVRLMPDGHVHLRNVLFAPLVIDGQAVGVIGLANKQGDFDEGDAEFAGAFGELAAVALRQARLRDEKNRLAERLRQAMKMQAIGRVATGVAHDFNNILTAIQGFTEEILNTPGLRPGAREDAKEVLRASKSGASLTAQLLAFSRKQVSRPEILDVNQVLSTTRRMIERLIGEDVDYAMLPAPQVWSVKFDRVQLEQVLLNLAINARDAMNGPGRVEVRTAIRPDIAADCAACGQAFTGDFVELAVRDDGRGMPAREVSAIFEPFYTTKDAGGGTGLGLATAQGLVHQAGGHLEVETREGHGTCFRVYLPRVDLAESSAEAKAGVPSAVPNRSVLLVEDQDLVRRLAYRILARHGYDVCSASSGEQAIEMLRDMSRPPDLLLLDVVLPAMNGAQLAIEAQSIHPGIRTLFMSGYAEDVITRQGVLPKDVRFIAKPFGRAELLSAVGQALQA